MEEAIEEASVGGSIRGSIEGSAKVTVALRPFGEGSVGLSVRSFEPSEEAFTRAFASIVG